MAKIVLYLPGNATHSFLIEDRWEHMFQEELGLHAIGDSGLPVAVSHQGLDYELFPFLKDVQAHYRNIEVVGSTYGHALLPLVQDRAQKRWEVRHGAKGTVPVTFFSEFYTPEEGLIPTEFFFFLKDQTCSYSMSVGGFGGLDIDPSPPLPVGTVAVKYGSRIGIVLDGFQNFLKVWFAFAAVPTQENLASVMAEFGAMAADGREFIIVPLDLEQPYVGSVAGAALWRMLFEAVSHSPSGDKVVPLSSILEHCRRTAVPIKQPHRILTKWTTHYVQLNHLMRLAQLRLAGADNEWRLFALASASDLLSSWNRKVLSSQKSVAVIRCRDLGGYEISMSQGHNQPLQDVCLAAWQVLAHSDESWQAKLESVAGNGLVNALRQFAHTHNL